MQYEPTAYDLGITGKPEADMESLDRQVERDLEFFGWDDAGEFRRREEQAVFQAEVEQEAARDSAEIDGPELGI
jgi:hypothetical protein